MLIASKEEGPWGMKGLRVEMETSEVGTKTGVDELVTVAKSGGASGGGDREEEARVPVPVEAERLMKVGSKVEEVTLENNGRPNSGKLSLRTWEADSKGVLIFSLVTDGPRGCTTIGIFKESAKSRTALLAAVMPMRSV